MWLFTDWMTLDTDEDELTRIAEVELEASRRDPYRCLSRVFHLVARRHSVVEGGVIEEADKVQ